MELRMIAREAKIKELLALNNIDISGSDKAFSDRMKKQDELIEELTTIAIENGTQIGRKIGFSIADGEAIYIITKENNNTFYLSWIDYCDGYIDRSLGNGGVEDKDTILRTIKFDDQLRSMRKEIKN